MHYSINYNDKVFDPEWVDIRSDYNEGRNDIRWLQKKNEVLERDNFTCFFCGYQDTSGHRVTAHHRWYWPKTKRAKIWQYPIEDLVCCCKPCNAHEDRVLKANVPYMNIAQKKVFTADQFIILRKAYENLAKISKNFDSTELAKCLKFFLSSVKGITKMLKCYRAHKSLHHEID